MHSLVFLWNPALWAPALPNPWKWVHSHIPTYESEQQSPLAVSTAPQTNTQTRPSSTELAVIGITLLFLMHNIHIRLCKSLDVVGFCGFVKSRHARSANVEKWVAPTKGPRCLKDRVVLLPVKKCSCEKKTKKQIKPLSSVPKVMCCHIHECNLLWKA